jgi:hypothetical protein
MHSPFSPHALAICKPQIETPPVPLRDYQYVVSTGTMHYMASMMTRGQDWGVRLEGLTDVPGTRQLSRGC